MPRPRRAGWSGVTSGAQDATNGVTSAAQDATNGVTRRQRHHWQRHHWHRDHRHKVILTKSTGLPSDQDTVMRCPAGAIGVDVRCGSEADICSAKTHVRFAPKKRTSVRRALCLQQPCHAGPPVRPASAASRRSTKPQLEKVGKRVAHQAATLIVPSRLSTITCTVPGFAEGAVGKK